MQALIEWLLGAQADQRPRCCLPAAPLDGQVGVGDGDRQAPLGEPHRRGMLAELGAEVGQHRSAPQLDGLSEQRLGGVQVTSAPGRPGPRLQVIECQHVELIGIHIEPVAACAEHHHHPGRPPWPAGFEQVTKASDIGVDQFQAGVGRLLAPERVHELLARHQLSGLQPQQAEQTAELGLPDLDNGVAAPDRQRPKHVDPQPAGGYRRRCHVRGRHQAGEVDIGEPQGGRQPPHGP